ncbi:MAG: patatin-like phospholipase family protein [Candidatus Aminicenantes bacterium]|nr:patatin-like phospholipase family protein [Candidatus Aminicenantes bacterium]
MTKKDFKDEIGLALGGGAVLGAAHIGVLRALDEIGTRVQYITGTSIGAFVGALYAGGLSWKKIEPIALDLKWLDISRVRPSRFGLLSNEKLGSVIKKELGDLRFEDTKIPLAMVATDIATGEKVVLNKGEMATAVMASTCIPGLFAPVEINGRLLVDGGVVENVPLSPLPDMGAKFVIGVDLNARSERRRPQNIVEVLLNTFDFLLMNATRLQTRKADLLIEPDLSAFSMVDTDQVAELIEVGYSESLTALKQFQRQA